MQRTCGEGGGVNFGDGELKPPTMLLFTLRFTESPLYSLSFQTVRLLLEYRSDPYQENEQGQSPIDVCKNPEILRLLREAGASREGAAKEDSEEEDVFIAKEKQVTRVRSSHIKSGSKGSSRSSAESLFEEEEGFAKEKVKGSTYLEGAGCGGTPEVAGAEKGKNLGETPKSRPRGALYSDLSSSESESDTTSSSAGKCGVRKVRYHLAKVGEAKQKLLGKLEETREADCSKGGEGVAQGGGAEGLAENGGSAECTGKL